VVAPEFRCGCNFREDRTVLVDEEDKAEYLAHAESEPDANTGVIPAMFVNDDEPDIQQSYIVYGNDVKIAPTRTRVAFKTIYTGTLVIGFTIQTAKDSTLFREPFLAKVLSRSRKNPRCVIVQLPQEKQPMFQFNGPIIEIKGSRLINPSNHILYMSKTLQINGIPKLIGNTSSLGLLAIHDDDFFLMKKSVITVFKRNSNWCCKCIVLGFYQDVGVWRAIMYVDAVDLRTSTSAINVDRISETPFPTLARSLKHAPQAVVHFLNQDNEMSELVEKLFRRLEPYVARHCMNGGVIKRTLHEAVSLRYTAIERDASQATTFSNSTLNESERTATLPATESSVQDDDSVPMQSDGDHDDGDDDKDDDDAR